MKNLNLTTSPFPYPQNQFGNSLILDKFLGVVSLFKPSQVLFSHSLCTSLRRDQELAGIYHPFSHRFE